MIILTFKTDQVLSEIALFDNNKKLDEVKWEAHRVLADTVHLKIKEILDKNSLTLQDINGIVGFKGPGSFTGLRIGLTVANTLAYSLNIPIVSASEQNWQTDGIKKLMTGKADKIVLPQYGGEAHITLPKK